ncbi:MAG: 3-hydroxyacyl-ACP dehydratase [Flavobacteriaceae bacterium]|nr:3-hydroxyacyl-ACP dehydratase [Flavobacteriaceae bacterium]
MILENFYTINSKQISEDHINHLYEILINNKHDIFKGHFPDNPVMPGVCMMQIIKEITESVIGKKLFMEKCSNVKFLTIINPDKTPILTLDLQIIIIDSKVKVKNTTKFDNTIALKLSAQYQILV